MANEYEYICTGCGLTTARALLTAKTILFRDMGAGARTIRSRTVDWLCPPCVKKDPIWLLPANMIPAKRKEVSNGQVLQSWKQEI